MDLCDFDMNFEAAGTRRFKGGLWESQCPYIGGARTSADSADRSHDYVCHLDPCGLQHYHKQKYRRPGHPLYASTPLRRTQECEEKLVGSTGLKISPTFTDNPSQGQGDCFDRLLSEADMHDTSSVVSCENVPSYAKTTAWSGP